jgi:protein TonB
MVAGICVLALHGLLVWVALGGLSNTPIIDTVTIQVSLMPQKPPPRLPPLPLPHFSVEPQIVAIQPRFTVAQPPPDAVRAVPPARAPTASEASQALAKPAPPPMDYLSRLEAHLNAYKNYPYDARIHREEGVVQLRFSLDRSGHVLSYDVVGSSGFASLDAGPGT